MSADIAHKIDQQSIKRHHLHTRQVSQHDTRQIDPFSQTETGLFRHIIGNRNDHLIEQIQGAPNNILMTTGQWIKSTRINDDAA